MLIYLVRVVKNGVSKYYYIPRWGSGIEARWGKPVAKWKTAKNQNEADAIPGFPVVITSLIEIVPQDTTKLAETYYRDKYASNFTSAVVFSSSYPTHKARKNLRIINAPKS